MGGNKNMRSLLERTRDEMLKDIHWTSKTLAILLYHTTKVEENPRWSYAQTGRDLNMSRAYISENIMLGRLLKIKPEIIHLSRAKALNVVRGHLVV